MSQDEINVLHITLKDIIEKCKKLEIENEKLQSENLIQYEEIIKLNETIIFYKDLYGYQKEELYLNNNLLVEEMVSNPYNDLPRLHQTLNEEQQNKLKEINNSIIKTILKNGGKSKKRQYNKKRRTHKKSRR